MSDPNVMDYDKRTPLHVAAAEGAYSVVEWLVKSEACPVNPLDRHMKTPLEVRSCGLGGRGWGRRARRLTAFGAAPERRRAADTPLWAALEQLNTGGGDGGRGGGGGGGARGWARVRWWLLGGCWEVRGRGASRSGLTQGVNALLATPQEAARNDHTEVVRMLSDQGGCVWEEEKVRRRPAAPGAAAGPH